MLKFIYGVMGSSKTAQALITKHNYEQNGFQVILLKPDIDTRNKQVKSRIGLKAKCVSFSKDDNFLAMPLVDPDKSKKLVVIVDEVQFCTKEHIEQLKKISTIYPVFCYGLKSNFKTELFEGSKRLLEIADVVEEIYHPCHCGKPATINGLFKDGEIVLDGEEVQIGDTYTGADTYYKPICYDCYLVYKELPKPVITEVEITKKKSAK